MSGFGRSPRAPWALAVLLMLAPACGGEGSEVGSAEEAGADVKDQGLFSWQPDAGKADHFQRPDSHLGGSDAAGAADDESAGDGEAVEPDGSCSGANRAAACPCDTSADCAMGWCVEARQGRVCASSCLDGCDEGWACVLVGTDGPDVGSACVPMHPRLCHPCADHEDCRGAWGNSESWCLSLGAEGRFCGSTCRPGEGDCPEGFRCEEVLPEGETEAVLQCLPEDGVCDCPPSAVGLETECAAPTEHGYCPGTRVCTESGHTECEVRTTDPEQCRPVCTRDVCRGGGCEEIIEGWCLIDGGCFPEDSIHPLDPCLGCKPKLSATQWSPRGGEPCDDGDACTAGDLCRADGCAGTAYVCEDHLECTTGQCTGDGGCTWEVAQGLCAVGGECLGAGVRNPLDPCLTCRPSLDPRGWSSRGGESCDDGDPCTLGDSCGPEGCTGSSYSCDDGLDCTLDSCDGEGGCLDAEADGTCLYRGVCLYDDGCADDDFDKTPNAADCAPQDPSVGHHAYEICNGRDDDCDGEVDEGLPCPTDGTGTSSDDPGEDCARIKADYPASADGVYWLKPDGVAESFQSYCDMSFDGGGWTLVLKVDGGQETFRYSSALWENEEVYAPQRPDFEGGEAKLQGFNTLPVSELRVGVRLDGTIRWGVIPLRADSMREVFAGVEHRPTAQGKSFWASIGAWQGGACEHEGFNIVNPGDRMTAWRARLGFTSGRHYCTHDPGLFGVGIDGSLAVTAGRVGAGYGSPTEQAKAWFFVRRRELTVGLPGSSDRPASSCRAVKNHVPDSQDGVYWIQPQGAPAPFEVLCDMGRDSGGWTLLASYSGEGGLSGYEPSTPQIQDAQGGRAAAPLPELFKDGVFGHVDHTLFEVNSYQLAIECKSVAEATWHRVRRADIFTSWTPGDKGTYGDPEGWGIIAAPGVWGRTGWSVCGSTPQPQAAAVGGIGYCKSAADDASSHMASVGFFEDGDGKARTRIGCNGRELGEEGRLRVWIR